VEAEVLGEVKKSRTESLNTRKSAGRLTRLKWLRAKPAVDGNLVMYHAARAIDGGSVCLFLLRGPQWDVKDVPAARSEDASPLATHEIMNQCRVPE
jgi:hypothetical protein